MITKAKLGNFTLWAAICIAATLSPIAASAATTTCSPNKMKLLVDDTNRSTTSTTFINVPAMTVTVPQGAPGCIVVQYTGDVATATSALFLRVTIDGDVIGVSPATRQFFIGSGYETQTGTFILPNVAAGNHVIRLQYRSSNGNTVYLERSNMIVHYMP